jgi:hypothetical protein
LRTQLFTDSEQPSSGLERLRLLFRDPANHPLERFFVHIRAKATRSFYELRVLPRLKIGK